ncbi:MAG: hypothetical protein LBH17_05285 [Oscillospiraceae bacterium]|jgi:hypothetical protein|nr:hypothetical protein [Oscillospiraceae bacterium]
MLPIETAANVRTLRLIGAGDEARTRFHTPRGEPRGDPTSNCTCLRHKVEGRSYAAH